MFIVATSVLSVSLCLQAAKCDRICRSLPASAHLPQLFVPSKTSFETTHMLVPLSVYVQPMFSFSSQISFCHVLVRQHCFFLLFLITFQQISSLWASDFPLTHRLGQSQANSLSPAVYSLQVVFFSSDSIQFGDCSRGQSQHSL